MSRLKLERSVGTALLFIMAVTASHCSSADEPSHALIAQGPRAKQAEATSSHPAPDFVISTFHGPCLSGQCPVYEVVIHNDRTVSVTGLTGAARDLYRTEITAEQREEIWRAVVAADFKSIRYDRGCTGPHVTCDTSERLVLSESGRRYEVDFDHGCYDEVSERLRRLSEVIARVTRAGPL